MNYVDVFFSRINHHGHTTTERIRNAGIRSFYKWLAESPHTVRALSVERGLYFDGIILSNKDKEYQKIMFLNVANDIALNVGDIMDWSLDDGSIEKWLLFQEEKKTNGTYRTFSIIRCNYLLKWIDKLGHLQQSWAYVVSSVDSKIKGNYRTWNSLITPQPNKYAEILMPYYPIERATNFIIQDESWQTIEVDFTSVPGTIYLSLTENKVNLKYDDLVDDIADTDKRAQYELQIPEQTQTFGVGDIIDPTYTLTKNGIPFDGEVELIPSKPSLITFNAEDKMVAAAAGELEFTVRLKDYPSIVAKNTISIIINNENNFTAYISGPDKIRLAAAAKYILDSSSEITNVEFYFKDANHNHVNHNTFAMIESQNNNQCIIKANEHNQLGEINLYANYDNVEYEKKIKIIPLW